jgi:hypothetical protein
MTHMDLSENGEITPPIVTILEKRVLNQRLKMGTLPTAPLVANAVFKTRVLLFRAIHVKPHHGLTLSIDYP